MGRKNKKAEEVTYFFEDGVITPPNGALSKDCRDAIVSVGTKYIYIGSKGNWKYKWKELSNLILESDDGSGAGYSMTFETEDDAMVDLSSCSRHNSYNNKNHNTWKEFHAFAMKRWDIILEKRERKRAEELAAAKKNSSKRNVRKKRIRPRNKVFGSKANRSTTYGPQPTMEWSDQEGDDILGDAETEIEEQKQGEENNGGDEDNEKEKNNTTNDIVDDDDEEENTLSDLDDDDKIVTNEDDGNDDDVIINSEEEDDDDENVDDDDDKTLEAERISSDDNNMDEEEDEEEDADKNEEEDEEEEPERKNTFFTPKRNPSKKKLSRIQSKLGEDGDSSDDDLFEKATTTMTTLPSTRKIVTPHSKEKVVSNNYFDSDDDNEEDNEEQQKTEVEEASQTKVSSFFAPRNSTMTTKEPETKQQVSKKETKKIVTKLSKQQVSKKETTKIVTKLTSTPPKSALTPIKQNNQEWLENTPPRQQRVVPTTPKKSLFFDKNKENNKENSEKNGSSSSFFSLKRAPPSTPMEDNDNFSDEENDMMYATELERKQKRRKFNQSSAFGTTISNNGGNQKTSSTADRALNFGNKMIKNKPHDSFIIKRREKTPMPSSSSATTSTTAISRQPRDDIENSNIVNNEVSRRWKGLKNLGNTCYLNSSLQLLFTLPDFVTRLDTGCGDLCRSITSVSTALCDENDNKSSISPRCVKEAVDHVTDQFMGYEQRDAHEFLSDLIDRLHEEQASEQKEQESTKSLATDEFFRTDLNVCLKCNTCGYERTMQEMYRHLSIEVDRHKEENNDDENDNPPPKWKVEDGLKKFFAPQTVEVACEKCKVGKTATQTFSIKSCPKALILQLKRFVVKEKPCIQRAGQSQPESSGEMIISKNKDPVLIPERFQLSDMANFKDDTSNDIKYKLSGVVHHHGTTPSSGHYTADVIRRNKDEDEDEWVSFDDWQASPSQNLAKLLKNSTNQRTSYMLLYTAI